MALFALLGLLAAACGDDDDDASTGSEAEEGSGSEGSGGGSTEPTGEPIKIASVLTIKNPAWSNDAVRQTIEAWVEHVNEDGGIGGRPLEYDHCDDEGDAGRSLQCVQDFIDEGVVAFVGNASLAFGANALPTVEEAKIPNVGGYPITPAEFNSEYNFPTTAGSSGSYPSLAVYLYSQGAQDVAWVGSDTPAARGVGTNLQTVWKNLGGASLTETYYDPAAADFVPTVSQVNSQKPDGLIIGAGEGPAPRMYQAIDVVGYDGIVTGTSQGATQAVFDTAGDALEGVIFSIPTLPPTMDDHEDVKLYNEVMDEYAPDLERGAASLVAASSIQYFVDVVSGIDGEITSESIFEALQEPPEKVFLVHSLSPDAAPEGMPRVWNPYNAIVQFDGEGLVLIGEDAKDSDYISKEAGVTWFAGGLPAKK
ncbi:MAG: ABC transporter substrate-binding protein [Acidimicrobiia bacterium]